MPGFNPVALGERLREEMGKQTPPLDVKALQKRVIENAGEARGTSYGSIWSYVNGQAPLEPRREVIEGMATVFGVLPDYLLAGGPRTPEAKQVAELTAQAKVENYLEVLVTRLFPEWHELDRASQTLVQSAIERFETAGPREWWPANEDQVAGAAAFAAFLALLRESVFLPLWAWDDSPDLKAPAVRDYLRSAIAAFTLSIPKRLPRFPAYRANAHPQEKQHWVQVLAELVAESMALHRRDDPPSQKKARAKRTTTKRRK